MYIGNWSPQKVAHAHECSQRLFSAKPIPLIQTTFLLIIITMTERYSFSLTTFSPSGKLVQIEYALNAVAAGGSSVGILGSYFTYFVFI